MVDMAIIGGISNSLNIALNISKAMLSIRDQAMIQEKVVELTSQIIAAQQGAITAGVAQSALTDRIRALEDQIIKMETWKTEKERYKLKDIEVSSFVYALKHTMSNGEPPHWICTNATRMPRNRSSSILAMANILGRTLEPTDGIAPFARASSEPKRTFDRPLINRKKANMSVRKPSISEDKPELPPEADDPEQSRRFIDMAREVEADETPGATDRAFDKVIPPPLRDKRKDAP
jgi:hypothetical protein